MMGDNDLEGSMFGQINQLMSIGSNEYLHLVVQIDGVNGMNDRPEAWTGGDLRETQRL